MRSWLPRATCRTRPASGGSRCPRMYSRGDSHDLQASTSTRHAGRAASQAATVQRSGRESRRSTLRTRSRRCTSCACGRERKRLTELRHVDQTPAELRKWCGGCLKLKPLSHFRERSDRPGKRTSKCKACLRQLCAIWRARNPTYHASYNAARKAQQRKP